MNKYQIGLAAAVLAASFVNNANAATINNVASGSVAVVGADCCRTGQVFSNIILDAANDRSNYLVFDLSSLASQLAGQDARSATLTLTQPGLYGSADPTETFTLWDFTGDVTALKGYGFTNPPNAADAAAIREDLRSGISYGSTVISQPAGGPLSSITITLDPMAIAAINSTLELSEPAVRHWWLLRHAHGPTTAVPILWWRAEHCAPRCRTCANRGRRPSGHGDGPWRHNCLGAAKAQSRGLKICFTSYGPASVGLPFLDRRPLKEQSFTFRWVFRLGLDRCNNRSNGPGARTLF